MPNVILHGGRREGSGRKLKYKETSTPVRVPNSKLEWVKRAVFENVQNQDDRVDEAANLIIERIKNEPVEIQQEIVCTMYYFNICDQLDKMPKRIVREIVVKLLERYLEL